MESVIVPEIKDEEIKINDLIQVTDKESIYRFCYLQVFKITKNGNITGLLIQPYGKVWECYIKKGNYQKVGQSNIKLVVYQEED